MRSPAGMIVLLVHALAGCGPSLAMPTTPTAIALPAGPSPAPITDNRERWNVTGVYTGHEGPERCIAPFDGQPRQPVDSVLLIQRSGGSIQFWTEHNHYVGRLVAREFSATDPDDFVSAWDCGTARIPFRAESSVSGRFSEDGGSITIEERAVFRLESGETITRHWAGTGTRQ